MRPASPMNGQIVLCKGVNDGRELDFSIRELTRYIPYMQSVSVVPVGLSRYREGLYPLEPFTPEECGQAIDLIESWQRKIYEEHGIHFIHASDEFYMQAGRPVPWRQSGMTGYIQLETRGHDPPDDGGGKGSPFPLSLRRGQKNGASSIKEEEISIATGLLPYPLY